MINGTMGEARNTSTHTLYRTVATQAVSETSSTTCKAPASVLGWHEALVQGSLGAEHAEIKFGVHNQQASVETECRIGCGFSIENRWWQPDARMVSGLQTWDPVAIATLSR